MIRVNWQWCLAAVTIGFLCFVAVWLPFWIAGLAG
jgi:hypothetical protein